MVVDRKNANRLSGGHDSFMFLRNGPGVLRRRGTAVTPDLPTGPESVRAALFACARRTDLIDDVCTINTVGGQFNAFCGKPAKHGPSTFVDRRDLAQVKPNRFPPRKGLHTACVDGLDVLAGERAIYRDRRARRFVCGHYPDHLPLPLDGSICRLGAKTE